MNFQEAINHCRHKNIIKKIISELNIEEYKNKSFEDIYIIINNKYGNIDQIGQLAIYDLTSGICKFYNILIDKIYIVGNGPKRAIKLLNIKPKIDKKLNIKYIEIKDIIDKKLNIDVNNLEDGDAIESFLCVWQKSM